METKTGAQRYYVTTSQEYTNLINYIPEGYEVMEMPENARVIIRKKIPVLTTSEEKEIVYDAIKGFSAIKDFFIYSEKDLIHVYHSQFNSDAGQDLNLSRNEAIKIYGEQIEKWMRFNTSLRFRLINKEKRLFQAERKVYLGFFDYSFYPIGEKGLIENSARVNGKHLGRDSFFDLTPN
ncbi:hypothetical protein [Aquimarina sp. RZ0]|uniref:hypothetical protein n=1 Tax=Aquimarina sp. RZ0 TaxID=2607730 RepID=UPI0011F3C1B8|nr:hypothetical protein [Aquimarina sp. RZ0]KAA1238490.1 hypothetical protein F0000_27565 [Aquimarina sp. RZ0]